MKKTHVKMPEVYLSYFSIFLDILKCIKAKIQYFKIFLICSSQSKSEISFSEYLSACCLGLDSFLSPFVSGLSFFFDLDAIKSIRGVRVFIVCFSFLVYMAMVAKRF